MTTILIKVNLVNDINFTVPRETFSINNLQSLLRWGRGGVDEISCLVQALNKASLTIM